MTIKTDLKGFKKYLDSIVNDVSSIDFSRQAGEFVADRIKKRTRLGRGIDGPLKPLSEPYKKARKNRRSELSEFTSPRKSNLTFTGQMLDAISVLSATIGKVRVGFYGFRKDFDGRSLTNKKVAEYVSKDRPFFGLTEPEERGLKKFIVDRIKKITRRS